MRWILIFLIFTVFTACNNDRREKTNSLLQSSVAEIPLVTGTFTVNGIPDDIIWQSAMTLPLKDHESDLFETGGDTWIAVRGKYLCLGARIPEPGRIIARSTGVNPSWWKEDMIIWMLRYQLPSSTRKVVAVFAVNPLGAYSLGSVRDIYNINKNDLFTTTPLGWADDILAATVIGKGEWSIEAALPLEKLGTIGFFSVQRIRAPRINTSELCWHWPGENEQAGYEIKESNMEPPPVLKLPEFPDNKVSVPQLLPMNKLAAEVRDLPVLVWSQEEQESLGVKEMAENSVKKRMAAFAEEEKQAWQAVKNVDDWESFRDERLSSMARTIGPFPERTPMNPVITGRIDNGESYIIENIVYESRPGLAVTANLYLPVKYSGKIPAIIVVHSHHAPKTQSELQDMGMTWARSGTAVLIMDQLCAGERTQTQPWPRESYYGRYMLGNQLYLAGESLIKWMAWDIIRGIDLLAERKYIDTKRIVLLGAVAGGGDPAALTAVLDSRIAAVIPFNFGEAGPEEHYTEGPRWYDFETAYPGWAFWETTRNLTNSVSQQFFPWFICAAVAPRKFIYSFEVGWPETVEEEPAWARYKKVFGMYNALDHLASVDGFGPFPGPGECTNAGTFLRGRIYPILNKWLDIKVPLSEYHKVLPEADLMCLTPSYLAQRSLKPASLVSLELVKTRLNTSEARRSVMSAHDRANALREELRNKLGDIDPMGDPLVKGLWKRQLSDFTLEAFSIDTEPGITIPFFLLTPVTISSPVPCILALAEGGKEGFLSSRQNEIAALLEEGIAVCLPDLRGCGELIGSKSRGPGAMTLSANELMLGGTLTGARLKDARTLFRWLAKQSGIDSQRIAVWGDSFSEPNSPDFIFDQSPGQQSGPVQQRQAEPLGPFLAVLTALYEESVNAVACRGGLISFSSVLENNFCHIPQDVVVPGLLEVADIAEITRTIAPRPVILAELVNGLNKRVSLEMMEKVYGSGKSNLTLTEKADSRLMAVWLTGNCNK